MDTIPYTASTEIPITHIVLQSCRTISTKEDGAQLSGDAQLDCRSVQHTSHALFIASKASENLFS